MAWQGVEVLEGSASDAGASFGEAVVEQSPKVAEEAFLLTSDMSPEAQKAF